MYIGRWGRVLDNAKRVVICDWGTVHVDNLVLDRPADAYQIRARLENLPLTRDYRAQWPFDDVR